MREDKQQYQTVLLLGNGFDLHYKLLTRYQDFLLTTAFLAKQEDLSKFKTYADLLGCEELRNRDNLTWENWEWYEGTYKSFGLPQDEIQRLAGMAKENVWFKYLLESFNKNVGWIDFEKEIGFVLAQFKAFFSKVILSAPSRTGQWMYKNGEFAEKRQWTYNPESCLPNKQSCYVISKAFSFFIAEKRRSEETGKAYHVVKQDYILEKPQGSGQYILNQEKVIDELYTALRQLAAMLEVYLYNFADKVFLRWWWRFLCDETRNQLRIVWKKVTGMELRFAVVLNYTHTADAVLRTEYVKHLHGRVGLGSCVLGINSDKDDLIDTVNTDFLQFKKYFQRVFYGTDLPYLKALDDLRDYKADRNNLLGLVIMGHSLDVTDQDVIEELVNLSDRITILYHSQKSVASYISNLVKIFGKEGFDTIRSKKRLKFQSINEARALAQLEYESTAAANLAPV